MGMTCTALRPSYAAGTRAAVCSLRHFIHWRHPAVVLEEASPWEAPLLYQVGN